MTKIWTWLKSAWSKFESWVAYIAPGLKTMLVTSLGAIGSAAGILQEYITGIPLDRFVSATSIAIISTVLFSLAFWFRHLTNVVTSDVVATS